MDLFRHADPQRGSPVRWITMLALAAIAPRAAAQFTGSPSEIAITGLAIPGTGGNAFSAFQPPVINNPGQIAFMGTFPGGEGVFSMNGHDVNTIPNPILSALNPPLATTAATFPSVPLLRTIELTGQSPTESNTNAVEQFFTFNNQVALNNATTGNTVYGTIALLGQLNNNSDQGIYGAGNPSQIPPVVLAFTNIAPTGAGAPPLSVAYPNTTTFTNLPTAPALNDNNAAAFVGTLSTGGQGLYLASIPKTGTTGMGDAASVFLVLATGAAAPGAAGNQFFTFNTDFPISLISIPMSSTNYLAFQAQIVNNGTFSSGIFVASGSTSLVGNIVAQTGTPSPIVNYTYQSFVDPVSLGANGGGQVAFRANLVDLNGGTTITAMATGLFVSTNGGATTAIAATNGLVGTPLPTGYNAIYPNGASYIGIGGVAQSLDGHIAFVATLQPTGLPGGGAGGGGIFLSTGSPTVTHIAVSGDTAPGTGGANYASFLNDTNSAFQTIFNDSSVAINDHIGTNSAHEVAFQAYLAGPGVNGSNNVGLFVANDQLIPASAQQLINAPGPNMTESALLARTGQKITTNPGVTETIQSFMPFYTRTGNGANSFNDLGELTAVVNFVEGGSGVYVFAPDLHLSQFAGITTGSTVPWGNAGFNPNPNWTFNYSPANQVYKVVIDPTDVLPVPFNMPPPTITVTGPTVNQSLPALQVTSNEGIGTFVTQNMVTLNLGGGAITSGINVLTVQGPSSITGTGTLKLLGDVTSVAASGAVSNAGSFTAVITPTFDLGNVPFPSFNAAGNLLPPSTAVVDRFRTFNVDRGNFNAAYPVDLLLTGNITSPSETITVADSTGSGSSTQTNDVHRGLLKTGPGVLRLTGANTFGPDTTIATTDDPYTKVFVQSIVVTGGMLSFANDGNLGLAPGGVVNTPPATTISVMTPFYYQRWITLDGGALGLQTTAVSTLANPTVLDANRGIALGPSNGIGSGTIDVFGTNVLDYEGVISDNADGIVQLNGTTINPIVTSVGVGALIKTGTGTLILSGTTNLYHGGTTVNGGTLRVVDDGTLGASGTAVTVNAPGTLVFTGTGVMPTTRPFTLNGGTLSVAATAATLSFNNTTVTGGFLTGPGLFATVAGGSTTFSNTTTTPSATLTLNGSDVLTNFSQGGQLTVAGGISNPVSFNRLTNLGSGSITVNQNGQVLASEFQSSGTLTLNPGTFNGATGSVTLLTNVGGTQMYFNAGSRTFISTPAQAPNINAGIDLNGSNAIVAGGLFVNNGFVIDSSGGGHRVVADYGATVKGAGFYQTIPQTVNGGTFSTGNSPGSATTGAIVLGGPNDPNQGLSNYTWQINDAGPSSTFPAATGNAGPTPNAAKQVSGWGLLSAIAGTSPVQTTGNFDWDATPADRLTIHLTTLLAPNDVNGNPVGGGYGMTGDNTAGLMSDFDPTQSYTWKLFTYQGTYDGPTDSATLDASTVFDDSGFLNPHNGRFDLVLNQSSREMDLTFTPTAVPEPGTLLLVGAAAAIGWRLRRREA